MKTFFDQLSSSCSATVARVGSFIRLRLSSSECPPDTHSQCSLQREQLDWLADRLAMVERDRLYHDSRLSICRLSRMVGTNRTYLTRAFRALYGESFCHYINRLRVAEAAALMREQPDLSLIEIARRVGYNSTTSLYRNFVRLHGCSPTHWTDATQPI